MGILQILGVKSKTLLLPNENEVLKQIGRSSLVELPQEFQILVWNIHKNDHSAWQRDFLELASECDFVLLQESYLTEKFQKSTSQISNMLWSFVTSFLHKGVETGVGIGSKVHPLNTKWLRSPGRELLLRTPKMAMLSEYNLQMNSGNLMVANIHGINFAGNQQFFEHIHQVITTLESHQGPLIFAGDFNTWNSARMKFVVKRCSDIGLNLVEYPTDPRRFALDHIFYRGVIPKKAEIIRSIKTSDHFPLQVAFEFYPQDPRKIATSQF